MTDDWQPAATLAVLRERAEMLARIRAFFFRHDVLEVETAQLSQGAVTDVHLDSLQVTLQTGSGVQALHLHTSPEFAMKRLLAAGSGPIYQIARVFRDGERSRRHNPEFSMLEWYRPGFSLDALMQEVAALVTVVLERPCPVRTLTYADAFRLRLGFDPHQQDAAGLQLQAQRLGLRVALGADRLAWLDLLFSHYVEPTLGGDGPVFLTEFPAAMASLARVRRDVNGVEVAARFELYIDGLELANGYHELCDAGEQAARFAMDNAARTAIGKPAMPVDRHLLAALAHGLPDCAGVALGLDRLLMVRLGARRIDEVIAFPIERA